MAQTNVQAFSGDVAISSNLAVDTNTLFVDSVGNKVGIGLTNPVYPLHISTTGDGDSVFNLVIDQRNNATVYYRKIAYVINNNGHAIIRGSMGSHSQSGGNGFIDVKFALRDGFTALGSCYGTINNTNIIVKQNDDDSRIDIYLVTGSYSLANLQITTTHGCGIFRDNENQPTSTPPSGTTTHDLKEDFKTFRVDDDGNVGIGTTNPIAALDIVGGPANDTTPALAIGGGNHPCSDLYVLNSLDTNTGVGFGAKVIGINIKNKVETDNTLEIRRNDGGLTSAGAIYLGTDDRDQGIFGVLGGDGAPGTTLSEFLTIRATGNVGIGTDSPTDRLDVHYPTPTYGSFTGNEEGSLTVSAGAEYSNAAVYFRTPLNAAAPAKMAIFSSGGSYSGAGTGGLHFCVENTLNNTTKVSLNNSRMVIKGNGYVGIGTVSPSYKLDVNGTVRFTSPWHSSSSITKARYTTSTYFNCIPTNTVTGYISYKVQIRFDPSPGAPPYAAAALVDWFPIGTNTANTNLNIDVYLLTTAHASNGINHSMYVSGTDGLGVGTSGLRCRTASDYYAGTFVTRWYQIGTND